MKHFKIILTVWFLLILINSCKDEEIGPINSGGVAPGPVTNPKVESLPGAAKISYSLPNDKDLLYVKAEYTNKNGQVFEVKSSYYTNSLKVEGFGDTSVYQVKLYAVNRNESPSEPVTVDVKPLTPPVMVVKEKLVTQRDFGGINIQTINSSKAELAIVVCSKDSFGDFVIKDTYYTKRDTVNFSVRGYDSISTNFAVYVRDRWNNRSDTVFTTLTPIFEKALDKSKFRDWTLPTDAPIGWGLPLPNLWDGYITQDGHMWHTTDYGMPLWCTFDLGVTVRLSRFTLWQRQGLYLYNHQNPKIYEIYGSTNPNADGSWASWVLLKHCVSVKPSGSAIGINTTEDVAAGAAGESWDIPLDAGPVRYIRIKVLESWSGGKAAHISEISFWGSDKL